MELRIGVVGMGTVGQATAQALQARGQETVTCDINPTPETWGDILSCDFVMVCTPETAVKEIVAKLAEDRCKGTIVVRSTVPPGTCKDLSSNLGRVVLHNPEFLRESHAFEDVLNPRFVVVGGPVCPERVVLGGLWMSFGPVFSMSSTDSEMFKLWSNAKLACNISLANELLKISEKVGANGHLINHLLSSNPLYSNHPWQIGRQYGGKCLPKDMKQLLALHPESALLRAVMQVNASM
jgi:UDPglucose 6-dehydrogenase